MSRITGWLATDDGDGERNGKWVENGATSGGWTNGRMSPGAGPMVPAGGNGEFPLALPEPAGKYLVPALSGGKPLVCDADWPAVILYTQVARRLAAAGDVFRRPGRGGGLVVVPPCPGERPLDVTTGPQFGVVLKDRVPLVMVKSGKPKGSRLPAEGQPAGQHPAVQRDPDRGAGRRGSHQSQLFDPAVLGPAADPQEAARVDRNGAVLLRSPPGRPGSARSSSAASRPSTPHTVGASRGTTPATSGNRAVASVGSHTAHGPAATTR